MKRIIVFFISTWMLSTSGVFSQTIEVDCHSRPLNELLIEWREAYQLQFSFNDEQLSHYKITIKQSFNSIDEALSVILKGLPLDYQKSREVYIIYPVKPTKPLKSYTLVGKIIEAKTGEPLPFSHIRANDQQTVTDIKGMFSFNFQEDSVYEVTASHLGCYMLDTVLVAGAQHTIVLQPSVFGIKEVVITNNIVEKSTQIGEASGLTSLNHHIANYLPGNGDNSVFNLLRLQPGILAAGEQPNDLIIWGSPEGTSRVKFDGFTIWGLKNFNDNISAVNPYVAKSIEIQKGGYGASNDDVVGGIVNIAGKNGNLNKPGVNLFINNQTLNGMVEVPLFRKSSLMLAFRQTYYNMFDKDDVSYNSNNNSNSPVEAIPDYEFRDFNIKYSLQGDNGDLLYMSMLYADDDFLVNASQERDRGSWEQQTREDNHQLGATLFYGKTLANGLSSNLKVSYSALYSHYSQLREVSNRRNTYKVVRSDEQAQNDVGELSAQWENKFQIGERNSLTIGLDFVHNDLVLYEDTFDTRYIDLTERANRLSVYAQDELKLASRLYMTAGLRMNHSFFLNKVYFDPRLSLSFRASGNIKLNASWGRYHQFLVKSSVEDASGNYRYSWSIADNDEVPVISSTHYVLGGAYTPENFLFSIDTYYKTNDGLTRFIRYRQESYIFVGDSRSYGIDFYAKKDFKGHSVWASYSLSKTEDHFPFYQKDEYRRAFQDQQHEVKLAGLLNLGRFHLSASYVYGSGFPLYNSYVDQSYTEADYNRLDASLVYRLASTKFDGEIGLSVLNLTDADNIKYNQFNRVPFDQLNTVYINPEAVAFTPLLYLKLHF
ncbi:TonB-dependent receptor [Carboxylicivirga mesophila]|uniref:TonB-dependent receptor n=1 Tax=Carboxylicivirga mesophila TaxID=1166478 RepID=UPI003140AD69